MLDSVYSLHSPKLNSVHGLLVGHIFILSEHVFHVRDKAQKSGLFSDAGPWCILSQKTSRHWEDTSKLKHQNKSRDSVQLLMCSKTLLECFLSVQYLSVSWYGLGIFVWPWQHDLSLMRFSTHCLPVDRLHLSGDAYNRSWRKPVKFLEKVPDVSPVF